MVYLKWSPVVKKKNIYNRTKREIWRHMQATSHTIRWKVLLASIDTYI